MDIKRVLQKQPKNLRDTIFKEIMHYEILESLFSINDIKNTLAFQGETALRLCYYLDRYSEDLDFVVQKDKTFNAEFMKYFKSIFVEKIIEKYNLEVEITEPKEESGILKRWSAKLYLPNNNKKSKINIEIANIPSYDNDFRAIKNNYEELLNRRIFVQVESLTEILADKIIALSQQPYIKARDLWDIEWLIHKNIKINYDLIALKIQDYQCQNFIESLQDKKIELNTPQTEESFLNEMSRFLDEEYFLHIKSMNFFNTIRKIINNEIEVIVRDFISKEQNQSTLNNSNDSLQQKLAQAMKEHKQEQLKRYGDNPQEKESQHNQTTQETQNLVELNKKIRFFFTKTKSKNKTAR